MLRLRLITDKYICLIQLNAVELFLRVKPAIRVMVLHTGGALAQLNPVSAA